MAVAKKDYRFVGRSFDGFDSDGNRKRYEKGDTVALSETEYKAFSDQFEEKKEDVKPAGGAPAGGTAKVS